MDYLNLLLNNLQSDKFQYLKYNKRIQAIVKGMKEELSIPNVIFNHDFSQMCSDVNLSVPKLSLFE
jgi:tRNA G26 N,N-dimethylase Trm1